MAKTGSVICIVWRGLMRQSSTCEALDLLLTQMSGRV
jgi:hypothetical protein